MKTALGFVGAFALVVCIFPTDANEVETELPLNFLDLPFEIRLDILEQLDFIDLIWVNKAHPENRNVIESIFRNLLKEREFRIHFIPFSAKFQITYSTVVADIAYKNTKEFEEILDIFKYFGHCITKLEYKFDYDSSVHSLCEQVNKHIAKYVAESVSEITFHLHGKTKENLSDLFVSYPNVRVAKLYHVAIDAATLHQMFPAVQSLDLKFIDIDESLSHFPYLESLKVPGHWTVKKSHLPLLEKTLQLNPQIKHLSIDRSSSIIDSTRIDRLDTLKMVNKIRPDLESLEIENFEFTGYENITEPIRFPNMKVFKCSSSPVIDRRPFNRIPLEFGSLEEIEFNRKDFVDHWVNVMMQNKKLRKVTARIPLEHEHLERIASKLSNLEEITMFYFGENSQEQTIIDFLQSANQLKKATTGSLNEFQCKALAEQLNNEWEITLDHSKRCNFVRK